MTITIGDLAWFCGGGVFSVLFALILFTKTFKWLLMFLVKHDILLLDEENNRFILQGNTPRAK